MEIIIYFGTAVVAVGIVVLGISIWSLLTHREKKYMHLLDIHISQKERVQRKLEKKRMNTNEEN